MDTTIETARTVKLTCWPSPQDYNEAVQNPRITLTDAELKLGQPELSELGLPRPRSGNFATVYKIVCPENNWAVRCFLHSGSGQKQRYNAIERALRSMHSDMTVPFAYLEEGLHVGNGTYPILKMEWAEGLTLDEFIRANLHNPAEIVKAASALKQLNLTLRKHGIAHGDLQHGNILIGRTGMKLVDYDGVFLPEFAGAESLELGHRNYQHPSRSARDFNAQLDNFAAWVIYVSLICLSEDPELWRILGGGDDCLLFRRDDFVQPLQSYVFCTLENHKSEVVRSHASFLRSLLALKLEHIPFLDAPITTSATLPTFSPEAWIPFNMPPELRNKNRQEHMEWIDSYRAAMSSPGGVPGTVLYPGTAGVGAGTNNGAIGVASPRSAATTVPHPASPIKRKILALFPTMFSLNALCFTAFLISLCIATSLMFRPPMHSLDSRQASSARPAETTATLDVARAAPTSAADQLFQRAIDEQKRGALRLSVGLFQQAIKEYGKLNSSKTPQTEQLAKCWHALAHVQATLYQEDDAHRSITKSIEYYKQVGNKAELKNAIGDRDIGLGGYCDFERAYGLY